MAVSFFQIILLISDSNIAIGRLHQVEKNIFNFGEDLFRFLKQDCNYVGISKDKLLVK